MQRLDRADALALLAAAPVLAIFAWWMVDDGGYAVAAWMPGLVGVACVLSIVVAVVPRRPSRPALLAIAALAAYTLWSFASILWAEAPGPALEGSQRTLLYLVCFASFALMPWTPRALLVLLGLVVLAIAVIGLLAVLRLAAAADPAHVLSEGRFVGPLGYSNASAALWTFGALPALVLASRPEVVAWLRPLSYGVAGALFGFAILTGSRGWLFTLPLVVLVALLLVPGRARLVLFAAPVVCALALVWGDLLEPYRLVDAGAPAVPGATLTAAVDHAARSLLLVAVALVGVGALAVWIDGRRPRHPALSPRLRRRLAAALLACLVAAGVAGALVATDGRPVDRADRALAELEASSGEGTEGNRFSALGSNRYDQWRVAWDAWRAHPVGGLGQDNFAQRYISERTIYYDESRWVHSLPLRLLAHTGLVGAILFVLFAMATAWAAAVAWARGADRAAARAAGAVALLPATVWIVHGSVDWLWEYPALSGPALALAGAATALWRTAAEDREPVRSSRPRVALACVTALACAAIVLPSYVADRHVREAAAHWPADPQLAFDRLERARSLNPLDARSSLVEGLIAVRTGSLGRARVSFGRAAAREPHDWFSRFELGLVAGARHDPEAALRQLLDARRLNPRDRLVKEAIDLARRGMTMTFEHAQREFDARFLRRAGPQ